ncbi:MAG: MerR family transcriptional regulator [Lachnospiraceae bacterium]
MHTRFTIGELAKLNHLSKQTLIFYDKKDVFKPNIVDETNGYRYYTVDQLEILDSILILKEMGLSLNEIKVYMSERNVQSTLALLKEQFIKNNEKINHLELVSKRLKRKIQGLENYCSDEDKIIIYESKEHQYLALEPVKRPNGLLQLDIALKHLLNQAEKNGYAYFYQIGAMIPVENLFDETYTCADYAFVPVEVKEHQEGFYQKPKGYYVRGYHTGPYQEVGTTYKKILEVVADAGFQPYRYSYEYCVLDSLTSKNKEDYVTEIQISIRKQ